MPHRNSWQARALGLQKNLKTIFLREIYSLELAHLRCCMCSWGVALADRARSAAESS